MKTRFNTIDIRAVISQLRQKFLGLRVANVYDIDHKTYLIKLAKPDLKAMILIESGSRIHSTEFEWPKNMSPSGFSMKLRKHLRTRRLEKIDQLGIDRIIDLQFGSGEAAYHVIVELYDRGNIVLMDYEYTILNILRPRTDNSQDVRFAVKEKYPLELAKQHDGPLDADRLQAILLMAKEGDNLKKALNPHLDYGPAVIEHCLLSAGFANSTRIGHEFQISEDIPRLLGALEEAEAVLHQANNGMCKGYIVQKQEKRAVSQEGEPDHILIFNEFHPYLFKQHQNLNYQEYETFDRSVDEFFSQMESQKLDSKVLQQEKAALKKLENVRGDHSKRIQALKREQDADAQKAQLIEINLNLVDQAITVIQSALANQVDWTEIDQIVKEAQSRADPVASSIKSLKLDTNHMTMLLKCPYDYPDSEDEEENDDRIKPMKVDIDLALSAYANARKFYDKKRHAANKEKKTMDASTKALKSAERKTKETLKEVAVAATINKARKTYWFEKFLWFISSENYLIVGGRDQQQNELVVKRHLTRGDLYIHADLHGASSCVIKNPTGEPVPPKTLTEAGTMAVCNSAAWDAKVVTSAWWVHHDQVSKTAPTGEYLTTGSFMIRGKKNYLPPCYLVYGFGFMFKLEEDSFSRHKGERHVRTLDDALSTTDSMVTEDSEITVEEESDHHDEDEEEESTEVAGSDVIEDGKSVVVEEMSTESIVGAGDKSKVTVEVKQEPASSLCFPDTSIDLQHVTGDKFTLQRNVSTVSSTSQQSVEDDDEPYRVYLGDNQPVTLNAKVSKTGAKLSAKQRREIKKKKLQEARGEGAQDQNEQVQGQEETDAPETHLDLKQNTESSTNEYVECADGAMEEEEEQVQEDEPSCPTQINKKSNQPSQPQPKRGQKGKLKKMREKYKDQDEEERELRMKILASSGAPKEEKTKKGKKGRQQQQQQKKQQQKEVVKQVGNRPEPGSGRGAPAVRPGGLPARKLGVDDIKLESLTLEKEVVSPSTEAPIEANEEADSDGEKQEEEKGKGIEDMMILDSLTGIPHAEDTLLYAIPVCAPYSVMTNYKFKVKLTPGTAKRGKAAKTALNMFQHDRLISSREKELLKVVKDTDLSRNMPGKVKVSAPNLHQHKNKHK